jgi:predicted metal-dependent hydrolase
MDYLEIGNTKVEYDLQYTGREKTIELVIDLNKAFTVKAPKGMEKEEIIRNLHKKSKWIINNLDKMADVIRYETQKEFVSGEKFPIVGKRYTLKIKKLNSVKEPRLELKEGKIFAYLHTSIKEKEYSKIIKPLLTNFYKERAEKTIKSRIKKYSKYFKIKPKSIRISSLKNKWGSCSKNNQLSYNWRIILAKMTIIDYVIVHELSHMIHKDHSKEYWKEVKKIIPNYEKNKEWLRINGDLLNI